MGASEKPDITKPETYDPHRMTAFSTEWKDANHSEAPKTIAYDSLGRVIKDAEGNTLRYNAFGQQKGFTNVQTGERTTYVYDSLGHQVAEKSLDSSGNAIQQPLYMLYSGDSITAQVQDDAQHHTHISVELGGVATVKTV